MFDPENVEKSYEFGKNKLLEFESSLPGAYQGRDFRPPDCLCKGSCIEVSKPRF